MLSNGQPHRALPLTVSLCMAVAARIEGSVVHAVTRPATDIEASIRIAMPSGILVVGASVQKVNGAWHAEQGAFFRTQRRMFDGYVYVRASRVPGLVAARSGKLKAA
jgi:2-methylaconitate cis-trans-isomerase PrpF